MLLKKELAFCLDQKASYNYDRALLFTILRSYYGYSR